MPTTTSRLALVNPVGADAASELRVAATASNAILDNAAIYKEGTLVSRPAVGAVPHGTVFYATDTGQYFLSNGSAWEVMLVPGAWVSLTMAAGYSGASTPPAAARVEGDIVRLHGNILPTTPGLGLPATTTLATVPAAAIPIYDAYAPVSAHPGSITAAFAAPLHIDPAGNVQLLAAVNASGGSSGQVYLDCAYPLN